MPVPLQKMLELARQHDPIANASQIGKAVASAMREQGPAAPIPHPSELVLIDEDEDPFGGNVNNRNVAERIAKSKNRLYTNASRPIHTGDPAKAAADIAKSRRLSPDAVVDDSDAEEPVAVPPSPGSPAALKAAEAKAKAKTAEPAVWKPNA